MEADVIRLRDWQQQGRHEQVLAETIGLLQDFPENRDLEHWFRAERELTEERSSDPIAAGASRSWT